MKQSWLIFLFVAGFFACQLPRDEKNEKTEPSHEPAPYKPGFGEFMSGIQVHHAKLWFAGINKNWALADFEINEIKEAIDDLKIYQQERPETKHLEMLDNPIDSISQAIKKADEDAFRKNFLLLTNTCNNCHKEVNFEFNRVKIPETAPFSNQDFSPVKK